MSPPAAIDDSWAELARATRDALDLLGHPIRTFCLPDELNPCGASFSQHAAAHFGLMQAIAAHQLDLIGPGGWTVANEVKAHELAELRARCSHQLQSAGEGQPRDP